MKHIQNILALLLLSFPLPSLGQNPPQYVLFFSAGAPITYFQNTLQIPTSHQSPNLIAIWSGLQPASNAFVYQTVIEGLNGAWWNAPQVCCTPQEYYGPNIQLLPGDSLKSVFELRSDGQVTDTWEYSSSGQENPFSGSAVLDPHKYQDGADLINALFSIEPQTPYSEWDFGNVLFKDIVITAQTTSTAWCTPKFGRGGFTVTYTKPVHSVSEGTSTCSFGQIELVKT
ncbi:uncharacterized protein PAC_03277 [Phialocephala subalpina]|uniref:Uncharacterized protein n=1 Tax=Phialocephala subalpina TaxID=576137 RepID=A0A1L7WKU9_9HELO|nr:uncharacterized protein PAC_03277 [Phialocephala subalpina]